MPGITILALYDRISCFHSLKPFLHLGRKWRFTWTDNPEWCLHHDRNSILIMVRQFIKPDVVDLELMQRLRDRYRTIAFFHDDAGGGIPRLSVLPLVDLFYAKALFRDRSIYGRSLYGKELYSDWYHRTMGIYDPEPVERPGCTDPAQLAKLRLSWNIGVGDYPRHQFRQRAGVVLARTFQAPVMAGLYGPEGWKKDPFTRNKGLFPVHARLGIMERPSIAVQRKIFLERIGNHPGFLTGRVPQKRFNHELAHSRITLSPFGWGELCLRDFEAVINGSLLVKPDMDHLETWPSVFDPGTTYVPVKWDGSDLVETCDSFLDDETRRRDIARNALESYRTQLDQLPLRFREIMEEITGQ